MLTFYALPSIIALTLKLLIFWFGRVYLHSASLWLILFFIGLLGINAMELLTFSYVANPAAGLLPLTMYYIFVEISLFALLLLALETANKLNPTLKLLLYAGFIMSIVPLLIPDIALVGATSIGYSITRIPGPYYFLVQLGILLPLLLTIMVLAHASCFGVAAIKRKSRILLLACSPILVTLVVVMWLMQLGYPVNSSVILSLMITVSILILLLNERQQPMFHFIDRADIYKFTRLFPQSKDHRFVGQIIRLVNKPTMGLSSANELIEQEMIREALTIAQGSKSKAATILGISRQTLQRKLDNCSFKAQI